MEKFSQYRDRGSGIAPFFPNTVEPAGIYLPLHVFIFILRIAAMIPVTLCHFLVLGLLPLGSFLRKAVFWTTLGIPGIWWIDIQVDGVRRGSLAQHRGGGRLPSPGTVIASSFTSPIDVLFFATIFDPIFTASWPNSRKVQRISLWSAVMRAFAQPQMTPPAGIKLTDLEILLKENPKRTIVVFPECTTSNSRGILPFSPSLLQVPAKTKIYPFNIRYTPSDIATPIPGTYLRFLWNLCSKPTHYARVRVADCVFNTSKDAASHRALPKNTYDTNYFDTMLATDKLSDSDTLVGSDGGEEGLTNEERSVLDKIAEDLARMGRVKRVGLGVKEKQMYLKSRSR